MTVFRFAFVQCLWRLRWTVPGILMITAAAMYAWPEPRGAGPAAGRTAILWLHAPALLATAALLAATIEAWPLYARSRPGADQVARLQPGALGGCLAVGCGALAALVIWLVTVGAGFAGLLVALGTDLGELRSQHRLLEAPVFLDSANPDLRIAGPDDLIVTAILLRPRSILSPGLPSDAAFGTTGVKISADGDDLHEGELRLGGQLEDYRLSFAPRRIAELGFRRAEGRGAPLMFDSEAIRAVAAAPHSWILGCVAGAFTYLFPAAMALALACLLRGRLALPIAVVGVLAVLIASTVLDLTPSSSGIAALSRGRWFPGEGIPHVALTAAAVAVVIIFAGVGAAARAYRGRR